MAAAVSPMTTGGEPPSGQPPLYSYASAGDAQHQQYRRSPDHMLQGPNIYEESPTVTPLHLLGDQPDLVDCLFCRRRVLTQVKKEASGATHGIAAGLFFTTFGGVALPYAKHWKANVTHLCSNCGRKLAFRKHNSDQMQTFGTPEHLREPSKFAAAENRTSRA